MKKHKIKDHHRSTRKTKIFIFSQWRFCKSLKVWNINFFHFLKPRGMPWFKLIYFLLPTVVCYSKVQLGFPEKEMKKCSSRKLSFSRLRQKIVSMTFSTFQLSNYILIEEIRYFHQIFVRSCLPSSVSSCSISSLDNNIVKWQFAPFSST